MPIPLEFDGDQIGVGIVLEQIPTSTELRTESQKTSAIRVSAARGNNSSFRIAPSFLDFAFLAPLGFLLARPNGLQSLLGDGDTGWHLRTGDWMLQNARIPTSDFFSFSKPGGEWFAWEWLWDVSFAWLHKAGGMAAVLLLTTLVICTSCSLLFGITKSKSGNSLISLLVTLIAMCAASFHWLARPHVFTFLFTAISYRLLETGTVNKRRMLVGLPLLMIVWTNLHGGFVAGLLIVAAYVAGESLGYLCSTGVEKAAAGSRAILYGKVFLGCVAATFVNPYFYRLHQHVLGYLSDGYQMKHIGEFQSISFHHPLAVFFEILLALGSAAAFWNLLKRNFTPVILIAGWTHLSLISGRNISIFAIVAAPIIAEAIAAWLAQLRTSDVPWIKQASAALGRFTADIDIMESIPRLHLITGAVVWLVGSLLYTPAPVLRFQAKYDPSMFPVAAVDEISKRNLSGRIFSTDDWSGYLIYRLYPDAKVFLDGRSDYYGPALGEEFSDIVSAKSGWENHLKKYGAETVLLPTASILSVAMKGSSRWHCVYDDGVAAIFRPASGGQQVSATISGSRGPVL